MPSSDCLARGPGQHRRHGPHLRCHARGSALPPGDAAGDSDSEGGLPALSKVRPVCRTRRWRSAAAAHAAASREEAGGEEGPARQTAGCRRPGFDFARSDRGGASGSSLSARRAILAQIARRRRRGRGTPKQARRACDRPRASRRASAGPRAVGGDRAGRTPGRQRRPCRPLASQERKGGNGARKCGVAKAGEHGASCKRCASSWRAGKTGFSHGRMELWSMATTGGKPAGDGP